MVASRRGFAGPGGEKARNKRRATAKRKQKRAFGEAVRAAIMKLKGPAPTAQSMYSKMAQALDATLPEIGFISHDPEAIGTIRELRKLFAAHREKMLAVARDETSWLTRERFLEKIAQNTPEKRLAPESAKRYSWLYGKQGPLISTLMLAPIQLYAELRESNILLGPNYDAFVKRFGKKLEETGFP